MVITFPLLLFYGPFEQSKKMVIGATMTSTNFGFLPRLFLFDDYLKSLYTEGHSSVSGQTDESKVVISNKDLDKIEIEDIYGAYKGKCITIHDPKKVVVYCSKNIPNKGQATSQIAKENDAKAAINGQGFIGDVKGTGGKFVGYMIHDYNVINGENNTPSSQCDVAAFRENGVMLVGKYSINTLKENTESGKKVKEAMSFGPVLLQNGKILYSSDDDGTWGMAPRTAIGQKANGEVIFLTIDGRSFSTPGITMSQLAKIFVQKGVINALNLDGGSSTTMYYNGKIINNVSNPMGERYVPGIFAVKK